ncbi:MAG: bifunctional 4-hydroxy-2-oxoglutarate aldolase/2-dehydro-3-deoxy-phosphogluconate aldolase [Anaerolineales bacterium]
MKTIELQIKELGLVPVIAIDDAKHAVGLGKALLEGGLPVAEVTFRTAAAEETIRLMAGAFPDMLVGAGTVLSVEKAGRARAAGAKFMVTPGFDGDVVDYCIKHGVPIYPGVATPTDINQALKKGLETLKFFPAEELGGVKMLKAMSAPYSMIKFIPTGGIDANNLKSYLELPQVLACGGSWMVKKTLISEGKFDQIAALVKEARQVVLQTRK